MKKTLTIVALILAITVSLIAGTMSYYSITIEELAGGSVVAKEFILEGEETHSDFIDVKIAPGEAVKLQFAVKNNDGITVTETDMEVSFQLELKDTGLKGGIKPLKITNVSVNRVEASTDPNIVYENGVYTDKGAFKADKKSTNTYTVTVEWPWETEGLDDIEFAGADFGSALSVKVTGTQVKP